MQSPRTVVLIVQYGAYDDLNNCIKHLLHENTPSVDICIVDNNPSGKREKIPYTEDTTSIHTIFPQKNLGYSGGCNAGLSELLKKDYEFFFVLNNDALIHCSDIVELESILDAHKDIGLAGPVVYDTLHDEHYLGMRINWKRGRTNHNRAKGPIESNTILDVELVEGCGMMLTRKALETIGYFDTQYFLYWEDTDLNIRIQEAGFRTVITPTVLMRHTPSQSTGQNSPLKEYYMTRNAFLFFSKHCKGKLARKLLLYRMTTFKMGQVIRNVFKGNISLAKTQCFAMSDYFLRRLGPSARFNHKTK